MNLWFVLGPAIVFGLAACAIVYWLKKRVRSVDVGKDGVKVTTFEKPNGGVIIERADAGRDVQARDRTGGGVIVRDSKAGGDIVGENTAAPPPKP